MGDDQSKARQTYSWGENLRIVKSLRTFNLATVSETHPISGVFAQLSSWMRLFWWVLHLEIFVVFESCLPAPTLAFILFLTSVPSVS